MDHPPAICQFCLHPVTEPPSDCILQCLCGAAFCPEYTDNLGEVLYDFADFFDIDEEEARWRIEIRTIRNFERTLDWEGTPEEFAELGLEVCLVFAKPSPTET